MRCRLRGGRKVGGTSGGMAWTDGWTDGLLLMFEISSDADRGSTVCVTISLRLVAGLAGLPI